MYRKVMKQVKKEERTSRNNERKDKIDKNIA